MSVRSRRRLRALGLLVLCALPGCNYGFRTGQGAFENASTIAIIPFENETTRFELSTELYDQMFRELPSQFGLRIAGEDEADILIRGVVSGYALEAPNYRAGTGADDRPEVVQRQVSIRVGVQIIDQTRNLILWEDANLRAQGQYLEASESEEIGKAEALDLLVQQIVDGAQSNW